MKPGFRQLTGAGLAAALMIGFFAAAPASAQTEVPANWSLIPAGLGADDTFRLLIVTSTTRNAKSMSIADYDTHVQNAVATGHASIQSYSSQFKALGSTETVNARDHTETRSTDTSAPIHYLNGAKVADDYADFYDGGWDSQVPRDESGSEIGMTNPDYPEESTPSVWTGTESDGTTASTSDQEQFLGSRTPAITSGITVFAVPRAVGGEIDGGRFPNPFSYSLYGLSPVFQVAGTTTNTAPTATDSSVTTNEDTAHHFAESEFNFDDTDAGDTLASVTVVTLPAAGALALDSTAMTAGDTVTKIQLDADQLTFMPAADGNGAAYASFTFRVSDGTDESTVDYSMTVNVTAVNDAATGKPTIMGTAQAGQELTAHTDGISDPDGKTKAENGDLGYAYTYQWVLVDGGAETDIAGETSSTYTLAAADVGKTIKVKVSFTDDAGSAEGPLTSDATATVTLTAQPVPVAIEANHDRIGAGIEILVFTLTREGATTDALEAMVTIDQAQSWLGSTNLSRTVNFAADSASATLRLGAPKFSFEPSVSGNLTATVAVAGISGASATVEMISTADPPITISYDKSSYTFAENAADVEIYVVATLDPVYPRAPSRGFGVLINSAEDTAAFPVDYLPIGGVVRFAFGDYAFDGTSFVARKLFEDGSDIFTVVNDDVYEGSERFDVLINRYANQTPSGLVQFAYPDGTTCDPSIGCSPVPSYEVTITDEEDLPALSLAIDATLITQDDGTTQEREDIATLTVSAASPKTFATEQTITLTFDGTAVYGAHYSVSPADMDTNAAGHQVILPAEIASVEITVTAQAIIGADWTIDLTASRDGKAFGATTIAVNGSDAVNTAPTASDSSVMIDEDTAHAFAAPEFNFADTDPGAALASVKVVTLPVAGVLALGGTAVTAGRVVAAADIGTLVFTPAQDANGTGYASFTFKVSDGTDESASAYPMTVNVTAVNDAATGKPTIEGTAQVGETLTAATTDIADVDGLAGATYGYQWVRVDADGTSNPTDIPAATGSTYTLGTADLGKKVRVKVRFTDDGGSNEELTSEAYPASGTIEVAVAGICGRTPAVRAAILNKISSVSDCANVTDTHLAAITGGLPLSSRNVTVLAAGDFAGLDALTRLNLSGNALTTLPAGVFAGLDALTELNLHDNVLTTLPAGVFAGLDVLKTLNLHDNALTTLPAGLFAGLDALTELKLYNNTLPTLPAGLFAGLDALTTLSLSNSGLTTLPDGLFAGLDALTTLSLSDNALTALPAGVFAGLDALTKLRLHNNALTALPAGVFAGLDMLTTLWLDDNALTALPAGVFAGLDMLTTLWLDDNLLTSLPDDVFEPLTALTELKLANNPRGPFAPTAEALPDDGTVSDEGGTVTLDGSDSGGAWGTNVTYSWVQSTSTNGVTFDDNTSATPEVVIPALAADTVLIFTLTVTGKGGTNGIDTDTDTATVTVTGTTSDDATLSALTVNDGTTDHTIDLATTPYTLDVGNAVTTVTLTATPTHTGASVSEVTLGGNAIADTDFTDGITVPSLAEGANVIVVTVTAQDGSTTQPYTVTVTRAGIPVTIEAEHESIGGGVEDLKYTLTRTGATTDALTVTVTLTQDQNWLTSTDLTHEVEFAAGEATKDLIIEDSRFSFDPTTSDNLVATVTGTGVAGGTDTVVVISIADPPITLAFDQDAYTFPEGGPADDVEIYVTATLDAAFTRRPSSMFSIAIVTGGGTATGPEDYGVIIRLPSFNPTDFTANSDGQQAASLLFGPLAGNPLVIVDDDVYEVNEAFNVKIEITPFLRTGLARVKKTDGTFCTLGPSGCSSVSYPVTITDDLDLPTLSLTAAPASIAEEDDTTTTGTVENVSTVTASIGNAKTFAVDQELTLTFTGTATYGTHYAVTPADTDGNTTGHQVTLTAGQTSVDVTVTAAGNSTAAGDRDITIAGTLGETAFGSATIVVRDDETTTSTDADLSDLVLDDASNTIMLDPVFEKGVFVYSATVANSVSQITVTPSKSDANASVAYLDGADMKLMDADPDLDGHQMVLIAGDKNTIKVQVTAQDSATMLTYQVKVTRNTAPMATDSSVTTDEDTSHHFAALDFNFNDTDTGDTLASVTVVTGKPTIEGTAQAGETLMAGTSDIMDADGLPSSFTYQWVRVDSDDTSNEMDIGSNSDTYTLMADDEGGERHGGDAADGGRTGVRRHGGEDGGHSDEDPTGREPSLLVFMPAADGNGDAYASFTFRVSDGTNESAADYSMTVNVTAVNDVATGKPTIEGTSQVGETLMAGTSDIMDADGLPSSFTYQWVRVDSDDTSNEMDIGSNSDTYTLMADDEGKKIRVKVSFTDDAGNSEGPLLSDAYPSGVGTVVAAQTTCPADNDWCATLTVGVVRGAITASGYTSDGQGALDDPTINAGNKSFTVSLLTISSNNNVSITFDNATEYLPRDSVFNFGGTEFTADAVSEHSVIGQYNWALPANFAWIDGQKVTVSVRLGNFAATGTPMISGTAQVGEILTASTSGVLDNDGLANVSYSYQWVRVDSDGTSNEMDIGSNSDTYTLMADDEGKKVKVKVTFTDNGGTTETVTSDVYPASGMIAPGTPTNTAPTATDSLVTTDEDTAHHFAADEFNFDDTDAGDTLASVTVVTLPAAGALALNSTAVTAGRVVEAADIVTLVFTPAQDANGTSYASFTFRVSDGTDESAADYSMTVNVTAVNDDATGKPTIEGTAQAGQELTAHTDGISDPDGKTKAENGDEDYAYTYQWIRVDGANDTEISGETSNAYTLTADDIGKTVKVKVSFTDDADNDEGPLISDAYPSSGTIATAGICARTPEVRDALVALISGVDDCVGVTATHLADIIEIDLSRSSIADLKAGDFAGLTALTYLSLAGNSLASLPAGVFAGLTALTSLDLDNNSLASLPAGVFAGPDFAGESEYVTTTSWRRCATTCSTI